MEKIEVVEPGSSHIFKVKEEQDGQRIDFYLSGQFTSYSRSFFEKLLKNDCVKINKKAINKKRTIIKTCDTIEVQFPEIKKKIKELKSELANLDIKIVYQNKHFAVIDKPDNLIVHATHSKNNAITLVDWILKNIDQISHVGIDDRPGIVHRLDKDTTGLIVIPKNNCSHAYFADLFKEKKIQKTYLAIVKGHPEKCGEIDFDIARNPYDKSKMTHVTAKNVSKIKGKIREAKTLYKVLQYFDEYSLVQVEPKTGRTHQIRVHFAAIGHPLLCDPVYGKKSHIIPRQALHAYKLEFEFEGEKMEITQEPPQDFQKALDYLQKNKVESFS